MPRLWRWSVFAPESMGWAAIRMWPPAKQKSNLLKVSCLSGLWSCVSRWLALPDCRSGAIFWAAPSCAGPCFESPFQDTSTEVSRGAAAQVKASRGVRGFYLVHWAQTMLPTWKVLRAAVLLVVLQLESGEFQVSVRNSIAWWMFCGSVLREHPSDPECSLFTQHRCSCFLEVLSAAGNISRVSFTQPLEGLILCWKWPR